MDTRQRVQKAKDAFLGGYNCAQATAVAFADLTGLEEQVVLKMASSFGGGMGQMKEVCGVVSGMALVAGLLCGGFDPADKEGKDAHYARVRAFATDFKDRFGTLICRELLERCEKHPRTDEPYASRACLEYVEAATEIFSGWLRAQA